MPRVLGRVVQQFSLRFAGSGDASESAGPPPAIQHERPGHVNVHQEHPGHVHFRDFPTETQVRRGLHEVSKDRYGNESGALPWAENLARHAVAHDSYTVHRFTPPDEGANDLRAYLVSDPQGRVTAHAGPEHDDRYNWVHELFHRRIKSGQQHGRYDLRQEVDDDEPHGVEANIARKHFRDAHEKAVQEGKVFVHTRYHPELLAHLRAIAKAERDANWGTKPTDQAPQLIFSDWLNEQSHDDAASAIRGAPEFSRTHGGAGQLSSIEEILSYLAHPKTAKADADFYRMNGVDLSLAPRETSVLGRMIRLSHRFSERWESASDLDSQRHPGAAKEAARPSVAEEKSNAVDALEAAPAKGKAPNDPPLPETAAEAQQLMQQPHLPPLRPMLHGHYYDRAGAPVEGSPFARPDWATEQPGHFRMHHHASELARAAMAHGKHLSGAGIVYGRNPEANDDYFYTLLADPQGNVSAQSNYGNWREVLPPADRRRPQWDNDAIVHHVDPDVNYHNRNEPHPELLRHHQHAAQEGRFYLTHKPESEHILPLLRTIHESPGDSSPPLILADHLDELGHSDLAERIRIHDHLHGAPTSMPADGPGREGVARWLTDYPLEHERPLNVLRDRYREKHGGRQLSLRLAHMTGFRPRRHEYTPKPRATDLRETDWSKIRHYFPEPEQGPKNRKTPVKVLINSVLFRLENQIPLRQLEEVAPDGPPWGSIHSFEYRVAEAGLWPTILSDIGRSWLIPIAEKLIHGVKKFQGPDSSAKVNVEGLPTTAE